MVEVEEFPSGAKIYRILQGCITGHSYTKAEFTMTPGGRYTTIFLRGPRGGKADQALLSVSDLTEIARRLEEDQK